MKNKIINKNNLSILVNKELRKLGKKYYRQDVSSVVAELPNQIMKRLIDNKKFTIYNFIKIRYSEQNQKPYRRKDYDFDIQKRPTSIIYLTLSRKLKDYLLKNLDEKETFKESDSEDEKK